ncbi:cell division protein FtsQ/DivIB [Brucella haematophila]|uniref:Cell division protein FtsQ n=1 Tax=Brucella haematophila TaxID=419474 RepID=A0ABX1DLN8_9HYPH|nr:cell division protein FtsQ/DivIB [Brucella haematophila]NKC02583.1 FtsQ-type POTRA domain-containing protein [Brucella haematophila]TMU96450.1 cell division protein FtsQ/DivIB [Brucella haematophila]
MFALNGKNDGYRRSGAMRDASAMNVAFVLPRFLRKPFRFAARLFQGNVSIPRHAGTIGMLGFLGATGLYGMVVGNHSQEVVKATASTLGFAIEDVKVVGNRETSDIDILGQLNLDGETSLVGLSAEEARASIAQLPWVESAEVRKVYPGTVQVALHERQAFAIWQNDNELSLIDAEGDTIVPFRAGRYNTLPLVVGDGAQKVVKGFVDEVANYPALAGKVRAYIRVADRRWDLLLDNGVRIMLPAEDPLKALAQIQKLDEEKHLLTRDITAVDLRLDDRITVQLTASGMEQRQKFLAERKKELARTGKRV